jgi:alpha-glucosidase
VYVRQAGPDRKLVALNLTAAERTVRLEGSGIVAISTAMDRHGETVRGELRLRSNEGVVVDLT